MRHDLGVRNDRSRILEKVAMVAFCWSLVAARRDDARLGNSVHGYSASPHSFNFFSLLRSERLAGYQKLGSLDVRSEEHTSELQSLAYLVCRLLLEKKKILIQQSSNCR